MSRAFFFITTKRNNLHHSGTLSEGLITIMVRLIKPSLARLALCMILTLLGCLGTRVNAQVAIDATNFPDANFRAWVAANYDDGTGHLDAAAVAAVTEINFPYSVSTHKNISDITGIAYFTGLKRLKWQQGQLTNLDLSQNTALTYVDVNWNPIRTININGCTALDSLYALQCNLSSINLLTNNSLKLLNLGVGGPTTGWKNEITAIDISGNPNLEALILQNNPITQLNINFSNNRKLSILNCTNCKDLLSVDISNFSPNFNFTLALDFTNCSKLESLYTIIANDVKVAGCSSLKKLSIYGTLSSLNVSQSPLLKKLYLYNYRGATIDLSKNTALDSLTIVSSRLETIDLSNNTALTDLNIGSFDDSFSELNLSSNTALESVSLGNTFYTATYPKNSNLTHVDLSSLPNLKKFICRHKPLSSLNFSNNPQLTQVSVEGCNLQSLDVSMLPDLTVLECRANNLESLDISNNTALTTLRYGYNSLTNLDLSKLSQLEVLECANNNISKLDISNKNKLYSLDCSNNQISFLDLSSMVADSRQAGSSTVKCSNNHLTSLDMTGLKSPSNNGGYGCNGNTAEIKPYSKVVDGQTIYFLYLDDATKGDNKSLSDMIHEMEGDDVNDAVRFDISRVTEWSSGCTVADDILILDGESGSLTYLYDTHNNNSSNNSQYKYLETFTLTWDASQPDVLVGDANGDGTVNVLDIVTAASYVMHLNPEPFVFDNADVNADGKVNITDVIGIANITWSSK